MLSYFKDPKFLLAKSSFGWFSAAAEPTRSV